MLGLVIAIILVLLVLVFIYLDTSIMKLNILKNIKNKYYRFILSLIPFILLYLLFGFINTVVIIFHLCIFEIIISIAKESNIDLLPLSIDKVKKLKRK